MKTVRVLVSSVLLLISMFFVSSTMAMPPHPDLLKRIKNGEQTKPYYLSHEAELRSRGIEQPCPQRTIDQLVDRNLDSDVPILAILVDFSDCPAISTPTYFDDMLFSTGTNSLTDFYNEVTYGNLTLVSLNLPSALGWTRAPETQAYYVNNQNGSGPYPQNAQKMVEDIVAILDPVIDFSVYDVDGDDEVDGLFIIHSGKGAESTGLDSDFWSFAWVTYNDPYVDGVWVNHFSIEPEYFDVADDMTMGVYAHEAGHAMFSFIDFYDRTGDDSRGLGDWSLMAGGSWGGNRGDSPSHPDPWHLIKLGVITPTIVTTDMVGASIPAIQTSPTVYKLWTNGVEGDEYFLVENRQQIGFDASLPGNGLLIYHIDDAVTSQNDNTWYPGHTDNGHYQCALEQADDFWDLETDFNGGDNGDPYPGLDDVHTFDGSTSPSSNDYNDQATSVSVTNISSSGAIMTADLSVGMGSAHDFELTVIRSGMDMHLRWEPLTGATGYQIHASTVSDFDASPLNMIGTSTTNEFFDEDAIIYPDEQYFYKVVVVMP